MREDPEKHWHLDKRVPLALIVTIMFQTGAALWWASALSTRVDQLERQIINVGPQAERIIRLETKMDGIAEALQEIKLFIRQVAK